METFTIIGDSQTSRWALTGYSRDNTDQGRLHTTLYESTGDYFVELYKDPGRDSADLVASGSISSPAGEVTISEENSSGLSGSVNLAYEQDSEFSLVVFYCCRADLDAYENDISSLLDASGEIAGRVDFESFCEQAKRMIEAHLNVRFMRSNLSDPPGREDIAEPSQLQEPACLAALSALYWHLKTDFNDHNFKLSMEYQRRLEKWLAHNPVRFVRQGVEIVLDSSTISVRRA